WARTMTFADCKVIKPPTNESQLCPNGHRLDAAEEYVWSTDSPINRLPAGWSPANIGRARSFAIHAITAQPLDYVRNVSSDVSLAFHWTPARHPKRMNPAFGFADGRWGVPTTPATEPLIKAAINGYDPGVGTYHSVQPYA